jgi:hypothetical protein
MQMAQQIERLARFVAETTLEQVPKEVQRHAKLVVLDTIGVILAGASRPEVRGLRERLNATAGIGATVFAPGWPTSDPRSAALLNGIAGRSLELGEGNRYVSYQGAMQIPEAVKPYQVGPARVQLQNKDPRGFREFCQQFAEHSALGSANTLRGVQMKRPTIYSLKSKLRALKVPLHVISGDEDNNCIDPSLFIKRVCPSACLTIFPATGHAVNRAGASGRRRSGRGTHRRSG